MKRRTFYPLPLTILFIFLSQPFPWAQGEELAYLVRRQQSGEGEGPSWAAREFLCEIFPERVDLIEYRQGRFHSRLTREGSFPSSLMDKVKQAKSGPWQVEPGPPRSLPSSHYYGHYVEQGLHVVELYASGERNLRNLSPMAQELTALLDQECDRF